VALLRNITVITLSLFSLVWTDKPVPGMLLACAALALALRALPKLTSFEIVTLVMSAIVLQVYNFVQFEYWRNLVIALTVQLNPEITDLSQLLG
jgi:hypothetical protein